MLHEEITKLQVALLLDFKQATLTWKRVAKEKHPNNPRNPRFKKLHARRPSFAGCQDDQLDGSSDACIDL
jgi:hypothetical protein